MTLSCSLGIHVSGPIPCKPSQTLDPRPATPVKRGSCQTRLE
jgi:hypothetical protein